MCSSNVPSSSPQLHNILLDNVQKGFKSSGGAGRGFDDKSGYTYSSTYEAGPLPTEEAPMAQTREEKIMNDLAQREVRSIDVDVPLPRSLSRSRSALALCEHQCCRQKIRLKMKQDVVLIIAHQKR